MTEGQVGILVSGLAIVAMAAALWRQGILGLPAAAAAALCAAAVAGFLVSNF